MHIKHTVAVVHGDFVEMDVCYVALIPAGICNISAIHCKEDGKRSLAASIEIVP